MLCKDCKYFKIITQPYNYIGAFKEPGVAKCRKHNLRVDFFSNKKFETLSCIEDRSEEIAYGKDKST